MSYFFFCSSFQGSFTAVPSVSSSTLASWPPTLRTSRRYSGWMMSRVSGSIEIGPRGLSHFMPFMALIRASPSVAPAGMPHCTDAGCLIYQSRTPNGDIEENCFRTIHAEINAIAQAAKNGSSIRDASIYITHTPCIHCVKVLVNTGIKNIYYESPYKLHTLDELLRYTQVHLHTVEILSK